MSKSQIESEIVQALSAPRQNPDFVGFSTWSDVLDAARNGDRLWYQAPMDLRPRSIAVIKVFKNGGIRVNPLSNQASKFTADRGHLDRFRRRA